MPTSDYFTPHSCKHCQKMVLEFKNFTPAEMHGWLSQRLRSDRYTLHGINTPTTTQELEAIAWKYEPSDNIALLDVSAQVFKRYASDGCLFCAYICGQGIFDGKNIVA